MRKARIIADIIILGLLLLWVSHSCSAEQVYCITEQELTTLQTRLAMLKEQRASLQQEFLTLKIQQEKLDKQVTQLEKQLAESKAQSQSLVTQLENVNKSFQQYAKEEKSKLRRTKFERNLLAGVLVYSVYRYIDK